MRFRQHLTPSCIGCIHRKRMGNDVWCGNKDLPPEKRPSSDAMRGCPAYAVDGDDKSGRESVRVGLVKIAARRSVR